MRKALICFCLMLALILIGCGVHDKNGIQSRDGASKNTSQTEANESGSQSMKKQIATIINPHSEDMKQQHAYRELRNAGKAAVPEIIEAAKKHKHLRLIRILGEIGDKRAVPCLVDMLGSPNEVVRCGASKSLGEIGDFAAGFALTKALRDKSDDVREEAAYALSNMKYPLSSSILLDLIQNDKNEEVRYKAALALGKIKESKAVPILIKMTKNPDNIRWEVLQALANIGNKSSILAIINVLELEIAKKGVKIDGQAIFALENANSPLGIPVLLKALQDKRFSASSIISSLKSITGQDFGSNAAKWLEWWEKNKDRILKEEAEKDRLEKEKAGKE